MKKFIFSICFWLLTVVYSTAFSEMTINYKDANEIYVKMHNYGFSDACIRNRIKSATVSTEIPLISGWKQQKQKLLELLNHYEHECKFVCEPFASEAGCKIVEEVQSPSSMQMINKNRNKSGLPALSGTLGDNITVLSSECHYKGIQASCQLYNQLLKVQAEIKLQRDIDNYTP